MIFFMFLNYSTFSSTISYEKHTSSIKYETTKDKIEDIINNYIFIDGIKILKNAESSLSEKEITYILDLYIQLLQQILKRFYLTGFNSSYRKIKSIKKNFENFKNKKPLDFSHERESSPEKNNLSKLTIKLLEDNQKEFNNNDSSSKLEDILPQKLVCIKKQQQKFTRKDTEHPVTNIYENIYENESYLKFTYNEKDKNYSITRDNDIFVLSIDEPTLFFDPERKKAYLAKLTKNTTNNSAEFSLLRSIDFYPRLEPIDFSNFFNDLKTYGFDEINGKISKLILEENQLFSCEISENSLSFIFERKTKIGKKGKKIQFFRSINSMTLHEEDESGFHRESHNSLYPLHR